MTVQHRAAVQELRDMHNITMATLHEEHARTMRGMISALTIASVIITIIIIITTTIIIVIVFLLYV